MATAGIQSGNLIKLYMDDIEVGCLTSTDLAMTNEEIDVTCKDNNGEKQTIAGQKTREISFAGYVKQDVADQFPRLIDAANVASSHVWKISSQVVGDKEISLQGFISSFNFSGPVNAGAEFDGTISQQSPATISVVA